MQQRSPHLLVSILLLTLLLSAGAAADQPEESNSTPGWQEYVRPVRDGGANGRAIFPVRMSGAEVEEYLDPRGFTVHATNADDPGDERVYPAGAPFIPPSGRWRYWLQGEWLMTPSSLLTVTPAARWRGVSSLTMPVAPAGRVKLAEAAAGDRDLELWLLYAGNTPGWERQELSRRRPMVEAVDGVLMPAGPVVAALWDRREERYVALSSEFAVTAGDTTQAPLELPAESEASVLAYTTLAPGIGREALADLELSLSRQGRTYSPDFRVITSWGVYQGWRALEPGRAVLSGGNELLYLDARTLELTGGAVAGVAEPLAARPLLEVTLVLPRLLREKPFVLEVRRLPENEPLAKVDLPQKAGRYRFRDGLVNAVLEVTLVTHLGSFRRQVDLTEGGEAFLELEPQLIEVYGTVRRDGERHPATVVFQTSAGDKVAAAADEAGDYRAIALQPLRWAEVQLEGGEQEPWRDFYMPPIASSQQLDFDISDAQTQVRVVDAVSREGIAGAIVGVRNEYWPPDELGTPLEARGRGSAIATSHPADEEGAVRLPPPRPGRVEIDATAPGYFRLDEPLALEVPNPPVDREIEISLVPIGKSLRVHLRLPDGSPAAGARVLRLDSLQSFTALFSSGADAAGRVDIPLEPPQGLLLLKHPAAAFGLIEWEAWRDQEEMRWTFPPAADRPLTVRVLDPAGESPAAGAVISLWVGDHKLSEQAISWLLGANGRTDRNGYWRAQRLPPLPLRLLATSSSRLEEERAGRLDSLATEIAASWPSLVQIRAVW